MGIKVLDIPVRISAVKEDGIVRDPDYDWTPAIPTTAERKRGSQCGECGMKFEYGAAYGYCCPRTQCPMGCGAIG